MVVAKLISESLNIKSNDFIKGNLLPDIVNHPNSHHKIEGKYYLIPDMDFFKQKLDLNDKLQLGYFTHLLLDKYFLEEYILDNVTDLKIFENKMIYKDYDVTNYGLIKKFNLDVASLKEILKDIHLDIDQEKLAKNLECLAKQEIGETKYLNFEKFSSFLYSIAQRISEEIKEYAN